MGIVIREADLMKERETILGTLNENRKRKKDFNRYDWLYLNNPFGQAKAWLAVCDQTGDIAGVTAVFPRLMDVEGKEIMCWNCGDFSINKKFRTLGAAVKLRSEATKNVNEGVIPFLYAHPNDRMKAVHLRVGHTCLGEMVRYARVLQVDSYVGKTLRGTWIAKSLGWGLNAGFALKTGGYRKNKDYSSELHQSFPASAPFTELMEKVKSHYAVLGHRNAEYLKWRFWDNPELDASILLVYRHEELVGYVIFTCQDEVMNVKDILCLAEEPVMNELFNRLTEQGRALNLQSISAILFETNPIIPILQKHGYSKRPERSSVMVHVGKDVLNGGYLKDKTHWYMTVGDRDV